MSSKTSNTDVEIAKASLKDNTQHAPLKQGRSVYKWQWLVTSVLSIALIVKYATTSYTYLFGHTSPLSPDDESVCPQFQSQTPIKHAHLYARLEDLYSSEEFELWMAELLSGAIQIPTITDDDMGPVDEDPRWEEFGRFHRYLRNKFPRIHDELDLTKINTYGLVYRWEGRDPSLKPVLLTAHQDVVPVEETTIDEWHHGPFSGDYDGKYIWGRGTIDNKGILISIMSTIETLLDNRFRPERGIVLAFGFDEEIGGRKGANYINDYLLELYGENGIAILVDEGGGAIFAYGSAVLIPSTSEKGLLNVGIEVNSIGGHSSQPPDHTSIGLVSKLLVALEDNPFEPQILREQAAYETVQCLVRTAGIPSSLKNDILESRTSDEALARVQTAILNDLPAMKYLLRTTQAITTITGGVKVNALPERTVATVNYRIDTVSSVGAVEARIDSVLRPVVEEYNLRPNFFGDNASSTGPGSVSVFEAFNSALEPAPKTPAGNSKPWSLLSSAIRTIFEQANVDTGLDLVIAPGVGSANTDTRHYWRLTPHIFRLSPLFRTDAVYTISGIHSVNEAISAVTLTDQARFFTLLILNADENEDL